MTLIGETLSRLSLVRATMMAAVLIITIGTNLLDFAAIRPGGKPDAIFAMRCPACGAGRPGLDGALILAVIGSILPVAALHLALTIADLRIPLSPTGRIALGVVDGAIQALQLCLTCSLGAIAWLRAGSVEARGIRR